jgi:3'-5' exoribonuclease
MQIKDISKDSKVEGVTALIEKRQEALTKAGKPYLSLKLRDKTGSIDAKLWDANDSHSFIKENSVVTFWALVDTFNGNLQLTIKQIEPGLDDISEFARASRFKVDDMWNHLAGIVDKFEEPLTKYVAEEILLKHTVFIDAFKKAPAAKSVHNAWYGGLLEHVYSLTKIAEPIVDHYKTLYQSKLSKDKVMFGLMLHDAGKIIEYDYNKPAFNMTGIGLLTNHLVLGPAWVYEKANDYMETAIQLLGSSERFKMERAQLMHLIAAHHGQIEWGSPVKPATLEAILVHQLDMVDSKMLHAIEYIEGKEGDIKNFSERSKIEGVHFYNYGTI